MSSNTLLLEVLISTLNEGVQRIENIFQPKKNNVKYLIHQQVWQIKEPPTLLDSLQKREDVELLISYEKGLSKNRNRLIQQARADICLIADDDIQLMVDAEEKILNAFYDNPDADIITFQIESSFTGISKNYAKEPFWYDFKKLAHVSSIEIAFRRKSIETHELYFDEDFGLGTTYPIGEEYIFLTDAYKKGLKILYCPEVIVSHPHPSSGGKLENEILFARGAVFARVFGLWSFFINLYFSLKKRASYRNKYTLYSYFKLMSQGSYDFYSRIKKRKSHA